MDFQQFIWFSFTKYLTNISFLRFLFWLLFSKDSNQIKDSVISFFFLPFPMGDTSLSIEMNLVNWPNYLQKYNYYLKEEEMYDLLFLSQQPRAKILGNLLLHDVFTYSTTFDWQGGGWSETQVSASHLWDLKLFRYAFTILKNPRKMLCSLIYLCCLQFILRWH